MPRATAPSSDGRTTAVTIDRSAVCACVVFIHAMGGLGGHGAREAAGMSSWKPFSFSFWEPLCARERKWTVGKGKACLYSHRSYAGQLATSAPPLVAPGISFLVDDHRIFPTGSHRGVSILNCVLPAIFCKYASRFDRISVLRLFPRSRAIFPRRPIARSLWSFRRMEPINAQELHPSSEKLGNLALVLLIFM